MLEKLWGAEYLDCIDGKRFRIKDECPEEAFEKFKRLDSTYFKGRGLHLFANFDDSTNESGNENQTLNKSSN